MIAVLVNNPRIMRDLPALLPDAGLVLNAATAHAYADAGAGGFFLNMAEAYAPLVHAAGLVSEERVHAWTEYQRSAASAGTFFGACNYFTYLAGTERQRD
jgi:hypothetical protein